MSETELLKVVGLCKTYSVGRQTVEALKGVSLSLPLGASLSITGYSGSGKSTLLGLIGGLDRPSSGYIAFQGKSYETMSEGELAALRRTKIGFVFQTFNLFPTLSAYENVFFAARLAGLRPAEAARRASELLAAVSMADRARHRPAQLSGGEQQRVAIARALAPRPALLLADEPTGDLDSRNGAVVADMLLELARGQQGSCIIVTHNLDLAARTDMTLALRDGTVVGGGQGNGR